MHASMEKQASNKWKCVWIDFTHSGADMVFYVLKDLASQPCGLWSSLTVKSFEQVSSITAFGW